MTGLHVLYALIIVVMIFSMVSWRHERRIRQQADRHAAMERIKIRQLAERAAMEAASCAAVIDRMDTAPTPRRRLHAVRDDHTGQSN